MAHDPKREDYQRLSLRFARELDGADPGEAARAFASFGHRFARDRDSLPQSDADRAFHLVTLATDVVDYQLPFASDEQAPELIQHGKDLLDEALSLDPACYDAVRMRSSSEAPSVEARYRLLSERAEEVRAHCEALRDEAASALDGERGALATSIAMRPYWRWLASLAEEALICGRNTVAVRVAEKLLASDPADSCDVRFTLAYALAKLEDEPGLDRLAGRYATISPMRPANDAWMQLARIALAHKRFDLAAARDLLGDLLATYPGAVAVLVRQVELPDGEFSRLRVPPYSEDELILAVSEGIVLLQEGSDREGRGVLGTLVAGTVAAMRPEAAARAMGQGASEGARRK